MPKLADSRVFRAGMAQTPRAAPGPRDGSSPFAPRSSPFARRSSLSLGQDVYLSLEQHLKKAFSVTGAPTHTACLLRNTQRRTCTAHPPTSLAAHHAAAHMITEDFVALTSANLHNSGVVLEDRSTREHLRVHSLLELEMGRIYVSPRGNSLRRVSQAHVLLAEKVPLAVDLVQDPGSPSSPGRPLRFVLPGEGTDLSAPLSLGASLSEQAQGPAWACASPAKTQDGLDSADTTSALAYLRMLSAEPDAAKLRSLHEVRHARRPGAFLSCLPPPSASPSLARPHSRSLTHPPTTHRATHRAAQLRTSGRPSPASPLALLAPHPPRPSPRLWRYLLPPGLLARCLIASRHRAAGSRPSSPWTAHRHCSMCSRTRRYSGRCMVGAR